MKAALLWPSDMTSTPPRPPIVGTDKGTFLVADFPDPFWATVGGLHCVLVQVDMVVVMLPRSPDARPNDPVPEVGVPITTHVVRDRGGHDWEVRCGYCAANETWYVKGAPRYLPDPDAFIQGA